MKRLLFILIFVAFVSVLQAQDEYVLKLYPEENKGLIDTTQVAADSSATLTFVFPTGNRGKDLYNNGYFELVIWADSSATEDPVTDSLTVSAYPLYRNPWTRALAQAATADKDSLGILADYNWNDNLTDGMYIDRTNITGKVTFSSATSITTQGVGMADGIQVNFYNLDTAAMIVWCELRIFTGK